MTDEPTGLRAQNRQRTTDDLAGAALRLFAEKGFENTTIDEIADAAGVSRRTFFRYFESKEAVAFAERERRFTVFRRLLADVRPGETRFDAVQRACVTFARKYIQPAEGYIAHQALIHRHPALVAYEARLDLKWEQAMAEALTAPDASKRDRRRARLEAGVIMGVIRAVLREWCESGGTVDLQELAATAATILRR